MLVWPTTVLLWTQLSLLASLSLSFPLWERLRSRASSQGVGGFRGRVAFIAVSIVRWGDLPECHCQGVAVWESHPGSQAPAQARPDREQGPITGLPWGFLAGWGPRAFLSLQGGPRQEVPECAGHTWGPLCHPARSSF